MFWEFPNLVVSNLVACIVYALLRSFASFRRLAFALFCARLRSFECVHLRVSASDRVYNDRVRELQIFWTLKTHFSL